MERDSLTGHAPDPQHGVVTAPAGTAFSLRAEDLPLKITAPGGRQYVINATKSGGLIMTAAV